MTERAAVLIPDADVSIRRVKWEGLGNGDHGAAVQMSPWSDRSVQVVGTFGSATQTIEGSNDGGTTWKVLTDPQGNAISFTATGIEAITELVHMIRPGINTGGGGTTDLDVYLMMGGKR